MGLVTWLVKVIRTSKGYLNIINYFQSQNCKQEMDLKLIVGNCWSSVTK